MNRYCRLQFSKPSGLSGQAQAIEITDLRKDDPRIKAVYRECQDAVLHRLHLAMTAFFRRIGSGETPGFPRYKPASRWRQLEFPHGNRAIFLDEGQKTVRIPGVGVVRLRKGRAVPRFGRVFVLEKNGRWYATFECQREPIPLPKNGSKIGVDRGVHVLAATSDGVLIPNAKFADRHRRVVVGHQRALESLTKRDTRGKCLNREDSARKAAARVLARAQERTANARLDALHKAALKIIRSADTVVIEKLQVVKMTRSAKGTVEKPGRNVAAKCGLNRVMLDAGFGILARLIREKAAIAVRDVVAVDPRYSSQTCGRCRHIAAKSRRRRRFACVKCGWTCHADIAAALEIRRRA